MIFLAPLALQGASLATKILIVVATIAVLFGLGFAAGKHWEAGNTKDVQNKFDKFVSNAELEGQKQEEKTKLADQKSQLDMEIANEQNKHARAGLVFYAERLRELSAKNPGGSIMPRPIEDASGSGLTCFDGAELIAADDKYRRGETSRLERIRGIAKKGAEESADLDTAKIWKQHLPVTPETQH
jgi:hypothetical protein